MHQRGAAQPPKLDPGVDLVREWLVGDEGRDTRSLHRLRDRIGTVFGGQQVGVQDDGHRVNASRTQSVDRTQFDRNGDEGEAAARQTCRSR